MFIKILLVFYTLLVLALIGVYLTKQRKKIISWAESHGHKNNFFIRVIRKKPRKDKDKTNLSKAFFKQ